MPSYRVNCRTTCAATASALLSFCIAKKETENGKELVFFELEMTEGEQFFGIFSHRTAPHRTAPSRPALPRPAPPRPAPPREG
jgi:hypothetical protein